MRNKLTIKAPPRGSGGLYRRGYLPHWEIPRHAQFITFRLNKAVPIPLLRRLAFDLKDLPADIRFREERRYIEQLLDTGNGERLLADPVAAQKVRDALTFFSGVRYQLHAWCIMPNHVHVLVTPLADWTLKRIVLSWKSYTANQLNKYFGRSGRFWHRDFFDRFIRNAEHFEQVFHYIECNPVKAGLCAIKEDWYFSSAHRKRAALERGVPALYDRTW